MVSSNGTRIAGKVPAALSSGAPAVASVRPERIRLFPEAQTANRTTGTVEALSNINLTLRDNATLMGTGAFSSCSGVITFTNNGTVNIYGGTSASDIFDVGAVYNTTSGRVQVGTSSRPGGVRISTQVTAP